MSANDVSTQVSPESAPRQRLSLNQDWQFQSGESDALPGNDASEWEAVNLPHFGRLEPYDVSRHFQGFCWYRKEITPTPDMAGRRVCLEWEAAMQVAEVWVNGQHRLTHEGGYLPFVLDISGDMQAGAPVTVLLRLDNRDNPEVPPGKPLAGMDFCYFSGLYRNVWLHVTDPLHISHTFLADKPGGGGVFVRYENVSPDSADVLVSVDVVNEGSADRGAKVRVTLLDAEGQAVAAGTTDEIALAAGTSAAFDVTLPVAAPHLWSPDAPNLYTLTAAVISDGTEIDALSQRIGIRTLRTDPKDGFFLNDDPLTPFGANRHQAYPYIGNALSDLAQYREARKLKDAGFDIIRLSHYPHAPAFMDACDELGLLTIPCIPGWQHFSDTPRFRNNVLQDLRHTIRRDRNHPSAVLWETSLNETLGYDDILIQLIEAAHEEYPGDQMLTCGDTESHDMNAVNYDVPYSGWDGETRTRPNLAGKMSLHREYGDNQFGGYGRYTRGDGETLMLVQAWNFQTAVNDHLGYDYTWGQCTWEAIDNNRGMSPEIATCGVLDPFRLPKFMHYFYQSQGLRQPMIYIANYWQPAAGPRNPVVVYSNCDEVELFVNGRSVGRRRPDDGPNVPFGDLTGFDLNYWKSGESIPTDERMSAVSSPIFTGGNCRNLKHPPFTFSGLAFEPGELTATGYRGGLAVVTTTRRTPGEPHSLVLEADFAGHPLAADGADVVFVHATVADKDGTPVPNSSMPVQFELDGDAVLIGDNPRSAEAGIASILVRAGTTPGKVKISASTPAVLGAELLMEAVKT